MRTRVEVCARPGPRGRTVLAVVRADGALAVRATGPADPAEGGRGARVHLVGTAAGPLGGDLVEIGVRVEAGASLAVRAVAATLALPHRDGGSATVRMRLDVAAGARLDVALEPVVVARGADLHAVTEVVLDDGGELDLTEQVQLGRWGEAAGRWRGTLHADLGGRPWVRQSIALGPGAPAWDALDAPRALVSRLHWCPGGVLAPAVTSGSAVRVPLALGGTLTEAIGADLTGARRDAAALARVLDPA